MDRLKTGIVGCGKVAHIHAAALREIPESDFTAVCSRSQAKADAFAAQYGVRGYGDLEAFLAESGVQALLVATPHPCHATPTLAAAQHGVHVLVEKPLASSLQDCDAMIAAMEGAGLVLGVISQRRCYEPVRRIKEAIAAGKIGSPILGTVTLLGWRDQAYYEADPWRGTWQDEGGGVLVNQAPHQLDLLQWYLGDIAELTGYWANLNHPMIEVEDTAVAVLRFRSGALGNIVVSNAQNPALYGKVHVHGSNGASVGVQTDGGAMFIAGMSQIEEPPVNDLWTVPGEAERLDTWVRQDAETFQRIDATRHYHALQIRDFLQAALTGRPPQVPGHEGRKTVELFTALYRSQRDGRPLTFPLVPETDRDDLDGRRHG